MTNPNLKVVGEITPPDYKDPVKMLRNIADEIERGAHMEIVTSVVTIWGEDRIKAFGGGRNSDLFHCHYLVSVAQSQLQNVSLGKT